MIFNSGRCPDQLRLMYESYGEHLTTVVMLMSIRLGGMYWQAPLPRVATSSQFRDRRFLVKVANRNFVIKVNYFQGNRSDMDLEVVRLRFQLMAVWPLALLLGDPMNS